VARSATHKRRSRLALALVCVAQFIDVLGVTIVVVALPSIGAGLHAEAGDLQWVMSIYALVFGGFLMLAGRAADLYGRRRLFMTGLALFAAGSLACGLAGSVAVLVAARAVQGVAAAIVVPAALSLLTTLFEPGPERTWALGLWSAAAAGGGASGFFLGGVITEGLGWQWIFFLNVPIAILALFLAPRLLDESRATGAPGLDVPGAATVSAGLLLLMFGLTRVERTGLAAPPTLGALALAVSLLIAFARTERRARHPLLPPALLRSRPLVGANLVALALTSTTSAAAVLGTLYAQDVLELSSTTTGLAFLPFSLSVIAGSLLGARLTARLGARLPAAAGLLTVAAGLLVAVGIEADDGLSYLVAQLTLAGLGLGCASVAATTAGTSAVGRGQQGLASGLLNSATQIGTALGIAVLVTLAAARTNALTQAEARPEALVSGYEWGFAAGSVVALAAAIAAARLLRSEGAWSAGATDASGREPPG
jgi:EmrB/QacA subfamily drug resistance transporter